MRLQVAALQKQHAADVEALQAQVEQLHVSRRETVEHLQAATHAAEGKGAQLEELQAVVQQLQADNEDILSCITQEADKVATTQLRTCLITQLCIFSNIAKSRLC